MRAPAAVLLLAACPVLFAQSSAALPGCEVRLEVREVLEVKLSEQALRNLKFNEQNALRSQVLEELIAQYPRELEPQRRLIQMMGNVDTAQQYAAVMAEYRTRAEQHPHDPLALYLAGLALSGKDTPQSIRFLKQARAEAPDFAWPHLQLANTYTMSKRVDKQKGGELLAAFFAICPASADRGAQAVLSRVGSAELQARVAAAMRARLAQETDPQLLEAFGTLWGLEFQAHPPQEHDALRKQVAADLKRLEPLNPKPDAAWLVFMKNGYKQSGASAETVTAMEDRVIRAFPHSEEAYEIVSGRWEKTHKEPEDQKDTAAWDGYEAAYKEAVKGWIAQFTESRYVQHELPFNVIFDETGLTEKEGLAALDDYLTEISEYQRPPYYGFSSAGSFLVEHKWQPERALDLLRKADTLTEDWHARRDGDNQSAEEEKLWAKVDLYQQYRVAGLVLRAAKLAGRPQEAERLKASIEGPPPKEIKLESAYWVDRGRLAALEGRKIDALTYYQKGLDTREPPQASRGKLTDVVTDEARALWKETGGTEVAWEIWSKPSAGKVQELAEGRWEKPVKAMPAFEMGDLSGKTWRTKSLEGKSVLINVWATWCVPCRAELPKLQKLYEKVKDRSDLQILTFNIDQDLGLVAPFVKDKGFTFPVLPAYRFVEDLLEDLVSIPQNWLLDPEGAWRWSQLGYDASDAAWDETMIGKLESVKTK